jgi:diguanylate cyclase (GGDEF)-like protein
MAALVITLAAVVLSHAWIELRRAVNGLEKMEQLRTVLVAAELASAERGPANGLMGSALSNDPEKRARLDTARQRTDAAFDALLRVLDASSAPAPSIYSAVQRARDQLQQGRQFVDAEARKPHGDRSSSTLRRAIGEMFMVIDELTLAMTELTMAGGASFPSTTGTLIAARQAALLREIAGQLGSQFTASITMRQRLTPVEQVTINRLRGRIDQLRQQLAVGLRPSDVRLNVQVATEAVLSQYFGSALTFIDTQTAIGLRDGHYALDTAEFAARYVPDMRPIVALRDALLDDAMSDAQQGLEHTRQLSLWTSLGCALMLTLLALTWWLLHRRVVLALTETTELLVTIAQGHLEVKVPAPKHRDEVGDMLGAIAVLRDNSIARKAAEDAIRQMAYYDRLTGLPNRRLLEDRMQQVLASAQRRHAKVAVMFIDLDKFKQVNDQHGHEAGDWLLVQVAQRMRTVLRESDTAARVGGDEFVVLLPDSLSVQDAVTVAEKIRHQMEQPFIMSNGIELSISSSIGVAMYPDQADNPRDLLHYGDEAMYKAKKHGRNAVEVFASEGSTPNAAMW